MDPRPTLDVDNLDISAALAAKRTKSLACHIHTSHVARRIYQAYRAIQHKKMQAHRRGTKKAAITESEDPDPYEASYVFYCL
uniref:Uncharacterized protein n=1 Tax=viral metagenome TaxID=1070528 RepID=A0A6C0BIT7_9ZZZZ